MGPAEGLSGWAGGRGRVCPGSSISMGAAGGGGEEEPEEVLQDAGGDGPPNGGGDPTDVLEQGEWILVIEGVLWQSFWILWF